MIKKAVSIKIAEMLTGRICHDLINSIGPANNCFDLLQDSLIPQERYEIEHLINNGVKRTLDLLTMIRAALSYNSQIIEYTALSYQKLLDQFLNDNRIRKSYEGIKVYFLTHNMNDAKPRCLLILLLCIRDCFIQKSHVTINFSKDKFDLIIQSDRLVMRQEIIDSFNHSISEATVIPQTIFCYMLQHYMSDVGIKLKVIDFQDQILHIQLIDR